MSFGVEAISAARTRVSGLIHTTPVFTSRTLNEITGRKLFFKAENLQKTGSFKSRGALNAVRALLESEPNLPGVVTHSSGNHGQALAYAAQQSGVNCTVVVPSNAPKVKLKAIQAYGAELVTCEPTMTSRIATCDELSRETGKVVVNPHNDVLVMAGQGTIGMELLEQVPDLDAVLVPVGGGGLVSGISAWIKHCRPQCKIFCVEPEGKELQNSLLAGKRLWSDPPGMVDTIADGIRVQPVGTNCFPVLLQHCETTVLTVLVIESSSGAAMAAALGDQLKEVLPPQSSNIAVILCGGNVDLDNLPWL